MSLYSWIDENIAQGLLPGGVSLSEGIIAQTIGGAARGALAPFSPAGMAGAIDPVTGAQVPYATARAPVGAVGPVGAFPAPMRGRTITEVYTVYPNGMKELKSVTPGGVKLYSRDVTAAKRTRKVGRLVNRLFPSRRRKKRK